jgi:hypothetical protein
MRARSGEGHTLLVLRSIKIKHLALHLRLAGRSIHGNLSLSVRRLRMGGACVRARVAPVSSQVKQGDRGSVNGGSVAGASATGRSASGRNKSGGASVAGVGYRNQVLQKIKADTENMGVTGVNAALGLDYIRFCFRVVRVQGSRTRFEVTIMSQLNSL